MKWRRLYWLLPAIAVTVLFIVFKKARPWQPPDLTQITSKEELATIMYGRDLIANTAHYLGPKGTVAAITNGMNCQNCHLDAGTKLYANSFAAVAANYPQYRNRSGIVESIEFRVNDCLQRSLNGQAIDSLSREMRAMVSYLKWLGKDVEPHTKPNGAASGELAYLPRAADSLKGQTVYQQKCASCHGPHGEGVSKPDSTGYVYPPLWGSHSYNTEAGLYRLGRLASFVKFNMPFKLASHQTPQLNDEQAWDVAAFVNSKPRPAKFFRNDWPVPARKSIDYPVGPFTDTFSAEQHKYGPFEPIEKAHAVAK